jgi:hypothetical protein
VFSVARVAQGDDKRHPDETREALEPPRHEMP